MVAEGLAGGLFAGNLLAFVATFSFAALTAIYRWRRHVDMIPTLCWSSTIGVLAGLVISGGVVTVSGHDLALCLFMGCIYNAVGGFLYVRASRYVPAGLLAFLSLSEIVLAPDLGLARRRGGANRTDLGRRCDRPRRGLEPAPGACETSALSP